MSGPARRTRGAGRERLYRLALRALALCFALGGALFALAPDRSVRDLEAAGRWLGGFAAPPPSELRFWVALSVAYMVVIAILAWLAQRDLRRYRHLIAILAAGKTTSSLLGLCFYLFSAKAFAYLATFLVDGAIALAAIGIWADVPRLGRGSPRAAERAGAAAPGAREQRVLRALLEALVPEGGAFPEGARSASLAEEVRELAAGSPGGLRLLLWLFELAPFALPPIWLRRFSRLPLEDRVRALEAWEASRFWPRREALRALKLIAIAPFYARSEVQDRLGYRRPLERVPLGESPAGGAPP